MRGRSGGLMRSSASRPNTASKTPPAPPNRARTRLSVKSWRIIDPLPAPRAPRMANSRERAAERASSRLAEFARTEGQWRPNLRGRLREKCSRRHDADDRVRLGVERDRLSDDVQITTETPLPHLVADQRDVVFAVSFLLETEITIEDRLDS